MAVRERPLGWLPTESHIREIRREVLDWFAAHGRDLPWRHSRDPYQILVSEVMLQQTQVSRVIPYFERFLNCFPTVQALAAVPTAEVLRQWSGLGYNRRAVNLQRAAREVVEEHAGTFPSTVEGLEQLSGIGGYTARAVACFAFEVPVAVVETNVRKAIRSFAPVTVDTESIDYQTVADLLLPRSQAWTWNQAMIDYGAVKLAGGPHVARQPRIGPKRYLPFEETDRFWRGRIVATLCNYPEPVSLPRLIRELPGEPDEYRIHRLVSDLSDEGLVVSDVDGDMVSLPT